MDGIRDLAVVLCVRRTRPLLVTRRSRLPLRESTRRPIDRLDPGRLTSGRRRARDGGHRTRWRRTRHGDDQATTTAIAYHRRSRYACVSCGRSDRPAAGWTTPTSARRWGRIAVAVAVVANLPYEFTRVAWYFGWPVGITDEFHQMMADTPGMLEMGLALALMGIGGGILTHGLVHRWGQVYPRWIWFKAGKRVPRLLAIIPASVVAVVLIPAGLMNAQLPLDGDNWAVNGPGILWLVWGAALGTATYAYYLRRRTTCSRCGRGVTSRSDAPAGHSSGSPAGSRRGGSPARAPRRSRTRSARSARAGIRPAAAPPTYE